MELAKKRIRRIQPLSRQEQQGYLFILPAFLMLLLVLGLPAAMAILNSFFPLWSEIRTLTLENYIKLAGDKLFWNSLKITISFVGSTVSLHLLLGLGVALALNAEIRGRRFLRLIAILPWTVPDVISGLM